jgi:PHD/YefM family antitoxin component YafN of YafNO toxin-antitoxin module
MGKTAVQYLTNDKGQKKAVVIPFEDYQELIEDLHDLSVIAERKDEPTISSSELKKRLKANGKL